MQKKKIPMNLPLPYSKLNLRIKRISEVITHSQT